MLRHALICKQCPSDCLHLQAMYIYHLLFRILYTPPLKTENHRITQHLETAPDALTSKIITKQPLATHFHFIANRLEAVRRRRDLVINKNVVVR